MQLRKRPARIVENRSSKSRCNLLMSGSILAASLIASSSLAIAKLPELNNSASILPPSVHLAQTARIYSININPGSLNDALVRLGEQTGLKISFDTQTVAGLTTPGLSGQFTSRQALTRLLNSTNLQTRNLAGAGVVITPPHRRTAQATELQGIIVQGELIVRDIQDTQSSVAVFTGEELERSNDTEIKDTLERAANVSGSVLGGQGFTIRGVESKGVFSDTGINGVIDINIDGASFVSNQGTFSAPFSTWDLEQVEVLRGPQSTQQGRNALAGAIKIRSKDPTFEQEAKARVDYGRFNERRAALALNVPVISEVLAFRFSGEHVGSDGFIVNPTLDVDDYAKSKQNTLRGKVRFKPIDNLDINFGYTFGKNLLGTANIDETTVGRNGVNFSDVPSIESAENDIYNLRAKYRFTPAWTLSSETTFLKTNFFFFQDSDNTAASVGDGTRSIFDESFTQETRVIYKGENLSGAIGLYYSKRSSDSEFAATFPTPIGVLSAGGTQRVEVENLAGYGELEWKFAPRFSLIGGLRYETEESSNTVSDFSPSPFGNRPLTTNLAEYKTLLPKAGLVYDWTNNFSTGFTYQQGYRAGGSGVTRALSLYEFDPEVTHNYELSVRSQWLNNTLTVNSNVFYTDWKDQQVSVQGPLGPLDSRTVNAASSTLYGFEIETKWRASTSLDLFVNVGYTKTRFDDFGDFTGNEFAFAPRWTGSIGGTYRFHENFSLALSASYTDGVFDGADNNPIELSDGYLIVDGRLAYEKDNWSAYVYGRNLLGEEYISRRDAGAFDRLGEPRVIGVGALAKF